MCVCVCVCGHTVVCVCLLTTDSVGPVSADIQYSPSSGSLGYSKIKSNRDEKKGHIK
jgi:hypothetical protein